MDPEEFRL